MQQETHECDDVLYISDIERCFFSSRFFYFSPFKSMLGKESVDRVEYEPYSQFHCNVTTF